MGWSFNEGKIRFPKKHRWRVGVSSGQISSHGDQHWQPCFPGVAGHCSPGGDSLKQLIRFCEVNSYGWYFFGCLKLEEIPCNFSMGFFRRFFFIRSDNSHILLEFFHAEHLGRNDPIWLSHPPTRGVESSIFFVWFNKLQIFGWAMQAGTSCPSLWWSYGCTGAHMGQRWGFKGFASFYSFFLPSVTKIAAWIFVPMVWVGDDEFQMSFPFWGIYLAYFEGAASFRECIHPGKLTWNQKMEV